jgi:prepilin-type N-terminal cleavage/methylation domain-containing protein
MQRSNANRGFTLAENLVVLAIVGIVCAIGTPSFLAMQQRQRLYQATELVANGLREAQQTAINRGRRCQITLQPNVLIDSQHCLVGGDRSLPSQVALSSAGLDDSIEYGTKGNTVDNRTIVLRLAKLPARCIVLSAPLGITRQGTYHDSDKSCQS